VASADWYTPGGTPATGSSGSSSAVRNEFSLIETALDKLPTISGNGGEIVVVNAGATALETVASITVAQGGTGVGTLTDGGVLLGAGSGNITAMAVLADGEMIVGDGTTAPVAESGGTLRTSIGLGSGDTVTFSSIVGTISTAAQGNITSLGTLTVLDVDNVNINGNTISSTAGTDLFITPLAGQRLILDGGIFIDDAQILLGNEKYLMGTTDFGSLERNLIGFSSSDLVVIGDNAFGVQMASLTLVTNLVTAFVQTNNLRMPSPTVPATAATTGNTGDIAWDSGFIYVCLSPFVWKRVAIATW
jgi:hypothetical protein